MWELSQNEDKRYTKETLAWWMGRTRACRSALHSIAMLVTTMYMGGEGRASFGFY